jgi:uncharacterized membrane protein
MRSKKRRNKPGAAGAAVVSTALKSSAVVLVLMIVPLSGVMFATEAESKAAVAYQLKSHSQAHQILHCIAAYALLHTL